MAAKLTGQLIPGHTEGGHMTSRQDVAILKKKKKKKKIKKKLKRKKF